MDDEEPVPERNRRLAADLARVGRSLGLDVEREFAVPSGRIDVVWLWRGAGSFPVRLPLVGFEIESSWRTRKHIKGDLLNLIELQPALGVIVLAGSGPKVAATRTFARALVERHAHRVEVWDEGRLLELTAEQTVGSGKAEGRIEPKRRRSADSSPGKYGELGAWLAAQDGDEIETSFAEIEKILEFPLPPSSRRYAAHWSGFAGSAVVRAIVGAGWRARHVDLTAERITFRRLHRAE